MYINRSTEKFVTQEKKHFKCIYSSLIYAKKHCKMAPFVDKVCFRQFFLATTQARMNLFENGFFPDSKFLMCFY